MSKNSKHFLEISQLTPEFVMQLILRAIYFKTEDEYPRYSKNILANLFYENSTRTRVSFELAARHLGISCINLDLQSSSEKKGEIAEDTLQTLAAMGVNLFVVRHQQSEFSKKLVNFLVNDEHIINAGDGVNSHPSQAMLDVMTIFEVKPNLEKLKIAIVGDILHSRVANSLQSLFSLLGVENLFFVAPKIWHPKEINHGYFTTSLEEGLANADVIITLRVQKERILQDEMFDVQTYCKLYSITSKTIKYAKSDVMVMHPGPINRGIEIASDVADGSHSYILKQVKNGVFMRMAIIESLITS